MVGAVRGRKFGRWVSKIGVERATDRRVKRSGEAGLLPPAPSPLYPNVLRPPLHRPCIQMCFAPPHHRPCVQMCFAPRAIAPLSKCALLPRAIAALSKCASLPRTIAALSKCALLPRAIAPFIQVRFAQSRQAQTKICRSSSLTSRGYRSANHWSWAGIRGGSCAYQFLEWITFRRWACCLLTPTGPGEGPWNSWISRSPRTVGTSVRPRYYSRGQGERRRLSRWLPSHTRQRENRSP